MTPGDLRRQPAADLLQRAFGYSLTGLTTEQCFFCCSGPGSNGKSTLLEILRETLHSWSAEIAGMWRFTRNNGITEGFHTKMELLQRQAYGFRNFQNYRLRVIVMCS